MSHPDSSKEYFDDKQLPMETKNTSLKYCNKCKRFLKQGKTMRNHRKGYEHKTGFESWTKASS